MKTTTIKNVVMGAVLALMIAALCRIGFLAKENHDMMVESNRYQEKIIAFDAVLSDYGFDAYDEIWTIDNEMSKDGHGGVDNFEFYYRDSSVNGRPAVLRVYAESVDGTVKTDRCVGK